MAKRCILQATAKVTIDSLWGVIYEKSICTKMNDLDLSLSFKVMSTIARHSPLNISETVRHRELIPTVTETAYGESSGHVTDDVT